MLNKIKVYEGVQFNKNFLVQQRFRIASRPDRTRFGGEINRIDNIQYVIERVKGYLNQTKYFEEYVGGN